MFVQRTSKTTNTFLQRIVVLILICILFIGSGYITFSLLSLHYTKMYPIKPFPQSVLATPPLLGQKKPSGLPSRLSIPSIGLDSVIAHAGLTKDGAMDIKENPDEVAWYQFGTRPGDEGSAVIAGHYGWTGLHGSVFNNLQSLNPGDKIIVLDEDNLTTTFAVIRTEKYDPNADATKIFQSYDDKAHLNLITCDGAWVKSTHSYSDRLVVFAEQV
jgi:LPXTG-site transpeptidase (sortase) family protein